MHASFNLFVSAAMLGVVTALPAGGNVFARGGKLVARGVKFDPSCDRANTFKPSDKYSTKVNAALADVTAMAKEVTSGQVIKGDVTYRRSDAFTHYFADEQYDQVIEMMNLIANPDKYKFNVLCGSDQDPGTCALGPTAATNHNADIPNIVLCDKFFDPSNDEVNRELSSRSDSLNPRRGWCGPDELGNARKFPFFSVSGLTLFHEITHLDYIGEAAGLSQRTVDGLTSHGTIDVYESGGDDNINHFKRDGLLMLPYDAARQLENLWNLYDLDHARYQPIAQTFENAESYAASALEWHFEALCDITIESDWRAPN